jgi:hypothetical protein
MKAYRLLAVPALTALVVMTACAQGPSTPADPGLANAAATLQRPAEDRARIYILSGGGLSGYPVAYRRHGMPADIFINGEKIGTVNSREAMVFDVVPGKYSMRWTMHNQASALFAKSPPFDRVLNPGQVLVLTADIEDFDSVLKIVPSANFVERGQLNPKLNLTITKPTSCPPAICP